MPRLSRAKIPASTRILRWWEMVGWVRPSGSVRSQTQDSPPSLAPTRETSRSWGGVGQGLEQPGEVGGLAGGDRLAQQRSSRHVERPVR